MANKYRDYLISGYDAYGNKIVETITIEHVPLWKRVLRRIGRLFGYGRWKRISSISIK